MAIELDMERLNTTCRFTGLGLDRLAKEQGGQAAITSAVCNIHANVAYLRAVIGDTEAIAALGEIKERVTEDAIKQARGNGWT